MIISLEGEEATGKSTFAYTAPLPIIGFGFDLGEERAIFGAKYDDYFKDLDVEIVKYVPKSIGREVYGKVTGDIVIYELPQPIQLETEQILGCLELWNYFIQLYEKALMDTTVSTIVIDTMTLARRLKADAYLQELQSKGSGGRKQLLQIEWGHANDSIRNLYTIAAGMSKNLVAVHHLTDERKDSPGPNGTVESIMTGNKILEGLSQTYRYVDIAVRMLKVKGKLEGELIKVGYNLSLESQRLPDPSWDLISNMVEMSLKGRIKLPKRAVEV